VIHAEWVWQTQLAGGDIMADSMLNEFDTELAMKAMVENRCNADPIRINFQFPPRIVSESNSSNWLSEDVWAIEPIKIHKGSEGRKVTMEWEYIVTNGDWTGEKISKIMINLKKYFFEFTDNIYPTMTIQYTCVFPSPTPFRLASVNITYSPEIVKTGDTYWPLQTKISCNLELCTRVQSDISPRKGKSAKDVEGKMTIKPLELADTGWY